MPPTAYQAHYCNDEDDSTYPCKQHVAQMRHLSAHCGQQRRGSTENSYCYLDQTDSQLILGMFTLPNTVAPAGPLISTNQEMLWIS